MDESIRTEAQGVNEPQRHPFLETEPATADSPRRVTLDVRTSAVSPTSLPTLHQVTNLDFDVTENCNLGCLYCFKGDMYGQNMSNDMMKKAFLWLLDASGTASSVNCNFMGGEPTMRFKQIKAFAPWARRRARARGKEVTFSMTTNLTLFTEEMRDFVDEFGFGVLMSIDGSPAVQDAQRPSKNGKSTSATVEYWAKSMLRTRPKSTARATLHPDYIHTLFESVQYIQSLGFIELALSASEYDEWTPRHFGALEEQLEQTVDFILELHAEGCMFNIGAFRYYINKLVALRRSGRASDIAFQPQPCGAGRGYMMIDYTGDIWPCHRFDGADTDSGARGAFRLGNIFNDGFNHDLQKAFIDFDHGTNHKASCDACPVNPVCGGYCPAANLSDTGSIYTPHDSFCHWSQTMYRFAERIYEATEEQGPDRLARLLASVADSTGTGEK